MNKAKNIVILGGGFAGLYTYLNLRDELRNSPNLANITIVSKENYFLFTPLLHEVATGSVNQANLVQPIRQILNCKKEKFLVANVLKVNADTQTVETSAGAIHYDELVLALGSQTRNFNFPKDSFLTLKTLEDARKIKNRVIESFEKANEEKDASKVRQLLTFVVVGGGPTGVELAAELSEFAGKTLANAFPAIDSKQIKIYLVHAKSELLPEYEKVLRQKTYNLLSKKENLEVVLNEKVESLENGVVSLSSGKTIASNTVILAAGVEPTSINIISSKISNTQLVSDDFLNLQGFQNIFLAGDMGKINSVPKTAQAAVEQGKVVAKNIIHKLKNQPLEKYVYKEKGQLVSLGRWMAVAEIYRFSFFGHLAWWIWRTIYASKIIGWANRVRVVVDWTIDIFYPRDISKL